MEVAAYSPPQTEAAWKGVAEGAMCCRGVQGAVTLARYMAWKPRYLNTGGTSTPTFQHLYPVDISNSHISKECHFPNYHFWYSDNVQIPTDRLALKSMEE